MIDESTLFSVMREVCNYFIPRNDIRCYEGTVTINSDYQISVDVPSPYIIIRGSRKNDGLYVMLDEHRIKPVVFEEGDAHPVAETFKGRVWFSYPPQDFINLCDKVNSYKKSINVTSAPVVSERFGESARSFAVGDGGKIVSWQENFGTSLRTYRKHMFEEIW